jgi:hypothetical protein
MSRVFRWFTAQTAKLISQLLGLLVFNFKYQYSLGFLADRSLIVGDISWQL